MDLAPLFDRLAAHYAAARARLAHADPRLTAARTGWSAAGHLWHLEASNRGALAAVRMIQRGRGAADPVAPAARAFLDADVFPPGRKAPEAFHPPDAFTLADLAAAVERNAAGWAALRADADALGALAGTIPHPVLGPLGAAEWVRFAALHTRHHDGLVAAMLEGAA